MNILALIWIMIIAGGIVLYVILDGFGLGIGLLSIFIRNPDEKDIIISTILPVWDGNETWLVFGGAALYGAFPLAFSEILPAIYLPMIMMVVALLLRGVALEFRLKANKSKWVWEISFFFGSLITTIVQGLILGTFVRGFNLNPLNLEMAHYTWLNPFSITCAVALIFGYALLGSNWLIIKTTGALQQKCYDFSNVLQYIIMFFTLLVSLATPFVDPDIAGLWFNIHYMPYLAIFPFLTMIFFYIQWHGLKNKKERLPFWGSIGVFLMSYFGFIISVYPYIIPRKMTYLQAAANDKTLLFMLVGATIMLPLLLGYTFYSYRLFKGKITQKLVY
jgi:cytochrome bd ubiquinol oxidase subunit II